MTVPRLDARPFEQIPPQVAERVRPLAPQMADEALREVLRVAPASSGFHAHASEIRELVADSIHRFCDLIEDPRSWERTATAYERIGGRLSREGRDLAALHQLMSRTARTFVETLGRLADQFDLDQTTLALITDAQLSYLEGLTAATAQGFEAEARDTADAGHRRRLRLISLLLADPAQRSDPGELAEAAHRAQWRLPRTLAAAVLHPRDSSAFPPLQLSHEILVDSGRSRPCLIVPDPDGPGRGRLLEGLLADWIVAVGPTLAPEGAAESLRWAHDALGLALRGVVPSQGLVRCADHVPTLAIFRAEELIDQVADARLAPLRALPAPQAKRLGETLLALLQNNFNATEVGAHLHVHPQTVRQRLRLLEDLFGDELRDPERCLEIEMILHARLAGARSDDLDRWSVTA